MAAGLLVSLGVGSSSGATTTNGLLGIDVSSIQGGINWASVRGCGVQWAFAKASEGVSYKDPNFARNMSGGKAAGMPMGAYHFAHAEANCPSAEANYFWSVAGSQIIPDGKSLFPAIDFEIFSGHACAASYTAWVNAWATAVKAKTSHFLHPVLAVSPCGGACNFTTGTSLELWGLGNGNPWSTCACCNYIDPCATDGWTYWLVNANGAICGISGAVDLDEYNGTLASLISTQVVH
jgi:GH25 family lysozyme M1 (1,4-beta-N-acetylmuramidase)